MDKRNKTIKRLKRKGVAVSKIALMFGITVTRINQIVNDMTYGKLNTDKRKKWRYERRKKLRIDAIENYGGKCKCCGEKNIVFLCIDHVDGGGRKHRKEIVKKYSNIDYWLFKMNYPKGFQVLCYNCNNAKYINGICPHNLKP